MAKVTPSLGVLPALFAKVDDALKTIMEAFQVDELRDALESFLAAPAEAGSEEMEANDDGAAKRAVARVLLTKVEKEIAATQVLTKESSVQGRRQAVVPKMEIESVKSMSKLLEAKRMTEYSAELVDFLDFSTTPLQALKTTFMVMGRLLLQVFLFVAVVGAEVYLLPLSVDDSDNSTARYLGLAYAIGASAYAFALAIAMGMYKWRSYIIICIAATLTFGTWLVILSTLKTTISGLSLVLIQALMSGIGVFTVVYTYIGEIQDGVGKHAVVLASRRAKYGEQTRKISLSSKITQSVVSCFSPFFVLATIAFYALVIFRLFELFESSLWKIAITGLAFVVKAGGNKFMLILVGRLDREDLTDQALFSYEFATALLLRTLQLSIPDEHTAQVISLMSAVGEMSVRQFFFNLYLKAGLSHEEVWTVEMKTAYARRGVLRVQDSSNDMMVEYISSFTAGAFIIYLAPTGRFRFATDDEISTDTVISLMLYQIVPEIFLDFYITFTETFGGLRKLHSAYWSLQRGIVSGSKYRTDKIGYLVKATLMKLALATLLTSLVLQQVIVR